jgi:Flp pilus assembly protein TadD
MKNNLEKKAERTSRFSRLLKEPAVAAALTMGLVLVALLAMPGLRVRVADNLTAAEVFLYGYDDDDAPANNSKPTTTAGKSGTIKKIITAPVRLVARIFRGKGANNNDAALNRASEREIEQFKAAALKRVKNGLPGESAPLEAAAVEAVSLTAAADKLFEEAIGLHDKGRVDAAIEKLAGSLVLNANNAEAYNMLAVCYDEKGQYKNAQNEYKKALKLSEGNARFLNNLGYSYYLANDYGDAVKWFSKGLKSAPDDKRLHNNLGLAYGRKGEFEKARQHFIRAVGEFGANLNLGYVYSQHGKYAEAIRAYEAALQAQPNSLSALSNLAQLYERTGRLREAAALNEQYKKLAVTNQQKEPTADQ